MAGAFETDTDVLVRAWRVSPKRVEHIAADLTPRIDADHHER
jgi:hypothetical protein